MLKVEKYDAGGRNMLAVVHDDDKVLVIGEGYITVWSSLEEFEKSLDGNLFMDEEPLHTFEYYK